MTDLDKQVNEAFTQLKNNCGGVRNDYFGLIYLEKEFNITRNQAINQTTFGGKDYGIDGFHFDKEKRNLYLFQFKYSNDHSQFRCSMEKLIQDGLKVAFVNQNHDDFKNQIINQLYGCILDNKEIINQINIRFVFLGNPDNAENSIVLKRLREEIYERKHFIDTFFEKSISLIVDFRSTSGKIGTSIVQRNNFDYNLSIKDMLIKTSPNEENMHIFFIRLLDLYYIYRDMGPTFFQRNIRYGLDPHKAINSAIMRSLKAIVFDEVDEPEIFTFNHNGISLYAESFNIKDENCHIISPRLLNGAQTLTTFKKFYESNSDHPKFIENKNKIESIYVLCKLITNTTPEFITTVTINNNRQNPVEPWNLHANDMIQLHIQDKFFDDLGIYYERQENAFQSIDMKEQGIKDAKAIKLLKLSKTFLVTDGNLQSFSNLREIFEEDNQYSKIFSENRLKTDSKKIIICYKTEFRLQKLVDDIQSKGFKKYSYVKYAKILLWALVCQGILNDSKIKDLMNDYGNNLSISSEFQNYISSIATKKCTVLLSSLVAKVENKLKLKEGKFDFLRTNSSYEFCMDIAFNKFRWTKIRLDK